MSGWLRVSAKSWHVSFLITQVTAQLFSVYTSLRYGGFIAQWILHSLALARTAEAKAAPMDLPYWPTYPGVDAKEGKPDVELFGSDH